MSAIAYNIQPLYLKVSWVEGILGQAGDADSSRAPYLTSGFWTDSGVLKCLSQFNNVNHGVDALVLVCDTAKITLFSFISANRFELNTQFRKLA